MITEEERSFLSSCVLRVSEARKCLLTVSFRWFFRGRLVTVVLQQLLSIFFFI